MILGITGGIGSGKSEVTRILEKEYDYVPLRTDEIASQLMNSEKSLKEQLSKALGNEIYGTDGRLEKSIYAAKIYGDPKLKEASDRLVHPAVWKAVKELVCDLKRSCGKASLNACVETALPGTGLKEICDQVWAVTVQEEIRIERLMETRGYTKEYALSIIRKQPSDKYYRALSDKVIDNSGTRQMLLEKIRENL